MGKGSQGQALPREVKNATIPFTCTGLLPPPQKKMLFSIGIHHHLTSAQP